MDKIIAYHLTVTIHEMYENGSNPDFCAQTILEEYDEMDNFCMD